MKELLKAYAKFDAKIKELEDAREEVRVQVLTELKKENLQKTESTYGIFSIATRTNWKYSEAVISLAQKLKIAKVKEEQKGTAKASLTEYLRYTAPDPSK